MHFDASWFICPMFLLGLLALVVWVVVRNKKPAVSDSEMLHRIEARLRDLTIRVQQLEKRTGGEQAASVPEAAPVPAPPAAAAAAPSVVVAAPPPATKPASVPAPGVWIPAHPVAAEEPPPLPFPPPLPPVPRPPEPSPGVQAAAKSAATREPPRASEGPVATSPPEPKLSLEAFLGGRVMLIAGVIVGLIGIAFFLKYAIDRGWITSGARIAMGVLAGGGLLFGGDAMRRRGFDVFGQALMGFGLGALYLSNYFACSIYEMIGPTAAFVLTAGITAGGAALALWRGAPVLAYLGFLGGYMAPWLLSKKSGDLVGLTVWLAVLDAGLLFVLLRRAWHGLDLLALLATAVYVAAWFDRHASGSDLGEACACLGALVAASLALGLAPQIVRKERPTGQSLVGVIVAGALCVVAGHQLLFPAHRWELGVGVAALGAAYLLASRLVAKRVEGARAESESLLGFAAAALATAVAVVASGNAVSPALSAAGLAIVFAGVRTRHGALLACGVGAIALACGDLLLFRMDMFGETATPFLNERFLVFACPCVALLAAGRLMSKAEGVDSGLATLVAAAGLLVLPLVLAADLYRGFRPVDDLHRELRFVAPAAALAVYGFLAARIFGRGSALGRALALVPVVFALLFGVTLLLFGHVRPFATAFNPTFAAGVLIVAAARFAARADEEGAGKSFGTMAALFLLALVTAEIHAWGENCSLPMHGDRHDPQFAARNWTVIAWAAFASVLAVAEAARRWKPLAWVGTGSASGERVLAVLTLAGAVVWHLGVYTTWSANDGWYYGHLVTSSVRAFANLVFAGGLAVVIAAHVVGRAPFDATGRVVRIAGLAYLLAVVTVEIHASGFGSMPPRTVFVVVGTTSQLEVAAWTTIAWALFASAFAWMGAARKVRALSWIGIDDERIEAGLALAPLAGAVFWGLATMVDGRNAALPLVLNLRFAACLVVFAGAFAVAARCRGALRDAVHVGAVVWGLVIATSEIHAWGDTCDVGSGTREEAAFRAIVWISVVWAAYAAALVSIGFARGKAGLRWMGLGVFALTLGKVFLVDMARLDAVYRIGSFLALGALLVAASFLYQRARRDGTGG